MMDSYHGILYVGDPRRGQMLHAAAGERGWYVYTPIEVMEALGQYIFYSPSVVVIEAGSVYAQEVYRHLRSVGAGPLVILADDAQRAEWNVTPSCRVLPRFAAVGEVIAAITNVLDAREPAAA